MSIIVTFKKAKQYYLTFIYHYGTQVGNIQESIEFINSRPKPLAMYAFTKNETFKRQIVSGTSSGSVIFNDVFIQVIHKEIIRYLTSSTL